nr:hypothetical protein Iba_chr06aCG20050 [Ipomoea batatas]
MVTLSSISIGCSRTNGMYVYIYIPCRTANSKGIETSRIRLNRWTGKQRVSLKRKRLNHYWVWPRWRNVNCRTSIDRRFSLRVSHTQCQHCPSKL